MSSMVQAVKDVLKLARHAKFRLSMMRSGIFVPEDPHFDPDSTDVFRRELAACSDYLEFGSGGSTLLAARLGKPTISIESDRHFAEAVRSRLPANHQTTLIHGDIGLTEAWGYPVATRVTPERLERWRSYTKLAFEAFSKNGRFPGLVLIDGRFRKACALETARQAHLRGADVTIFFDDYAMRPGYHEVEKWLGQPEMHGRAALFRIRDGQLSAPLTEADVRAAHEDVH